MPRAIWSGSISFGLVSFPVKMFSAVEEHKLHFHYVHAPDGSRIGYQKICKAEEPVPDEEIVKAFVEAKRKGEEIHVPEKPEPEAPTDLMAALRASVEAAQKERKSAKGRKRRAKAA